MNNPLLKGSYSPCRFCAAGLCSAGRGPPRACRAAMGAPHRPGAPGGRACPTRAGPDRRQERRRGWRTEETLAARVHRLPKGQAVGADVWRRRDQSGNSRSAAFRNAVAEGVDDRGDLIDADARDLPFPADSFDAVMSNLTISNIRQEALRRGRHCTKPYGYCDPAADCGSLTTGQVSTRRRCMPRNAPTSPSGGWTGGHRSGYRAITCTSSQPVSHRASQ